MTETEDVMTALPFTGPGRLARGTSGTTRSRRQRWSTDQARRAHQLEGQRPPEADRTDRYVDREGGRFPLSVVVALWQR